MKTSDLFNRAKQLADLEGSDFISWNEAVNCINESNVGLYEKLISMGDNSFVKSYRTTKEEEELPEDFWQLKGVFLWDNGNLQTINRRADNNGIHHLSYELRNGKLYLYGNPNDVLVEYFPKPKQLFFPPAEVSITLPEETNRLYLDCYGHDFLVCDKETRDNVETAVFKIYNYDSNTFYEIATSPYYSTTDEYYLSRLTKNYAILVVYEDIINVILYDLNTENSVKIPFQTEWADNGYGFVITESDDLFIYTDNKIYDISIADNQLELTEVKELSDNLLKTTYLYIASNDTLDDFYFLSSPRDHESGFEMGLYHNFTKIMDNPYHKLYYKNRMCYFLRFAVVPGAIGYGFIENDEIHQIYKSIPLPVGLVGLNERTGYGICVYRRGAYYILPYCEDTPLNYPNSTYFQIISYILAIAFKSKQGADITLLQNQLAMIEQTFEETLGSDDFQFTRMGNVYN